MGFDDVLDQVVFEVLPLRAQLSAPGGVLPVLGLVAAEAPVDEKARLANIPVQDRGLDGFPGGGPEVHIRVPVGDASQIVLERQAAQLGAVVQDRQDGMPGVDLGFEGATGDRRGRGAGCRPFSPPRTPPLNPFPLTLALTLTLTLAPWEGLGSPFIHHRKGLESPFGAPCKGLASPFGAPREGLGRARRAEHF